MTRVCRFLPFRAGGASALLVVIIALVEFCWINGSMAAWSFDPPHGLPVITGLIDIPYQVIASDGSGGVFIAWQSVTSQYSGGNISGASGFGVGERAGLTAAC